MEKDYELKKHMHSIASQYHLHFSNVRTASTSLLLPIGLFASVNMLVQCPKSAIFFPIFFITFIFLVTFLLNAVFSGWSRACRRIERYYEVKLNNNDGYNPEIDGFRHIFRVITPIFGKTQSSSSQPDNFPKPLRWFRIDGDWVDPFVIFVIAFSIIYTILYVIALDKVCYYVPPPT